MSDLTREEVEKLLDAMPEKGSGEPVADFLLTHAEVNMLNASEQIALQLLRQLDENKRLRKFLEELRINPDHYIPEMFDKDCPICGFQPARVNDHVDAALAVNPGPSNEYTEEKK